MFESIEDVVIQVAHMMELAARTAPKTRGEDFVKTQVLKGNKIEILAETMRALGKKTGGARFERDGANIAQSIAVVLIGLEKARPAELDCGACGYAGCKDLLAAVPSELEFTGPICSFRLLDVGIALGSAVKTAQIHNVDNRIMYTAGSAARANKMVDWDFVVGIPLSASGKSIYFDRK